MKILVRPSLLAAALFAFPMNCDAIPVLPGQFDMAHSGKAGFSGELRDPASFNFDRRIAFVTDGIEKIQVHLVSPEPIRRQTEFVQLNKLGSLPSRKEAPAFYDVGVVRELGGTGDPAPGRSPSSVPEPSSLLFLSIGLVGVAAWRRKQTA